MAKLTPNKDAPSRSQRNVLLKYLLVFAKRVYRPIKPMINPLLKKVRFWQILVGLIGLMLFGSFWPVHQNYRAQEKAAWWPWSTSVHSQMALAWLDAGNEVMALKELELANKLLIVKTTKAETALRKAEEAVKRPGEIRREIESWEKILETRPEYRDVYLRLSLLNFSIYNNEEAKLNWEKANYLDPNNKEVQEVGEIIFSLL